LTPFAFGVHALHVSSLLMANGERQIASEQSTDGIERAMSILQNLYRLLADSGAVGVVRTGSSRKVYKPKLRHFLPVVFVPKSVFRPVFTLNRSSVHFPRKWYHIVDIIRCVF